MLSFDEFYRQRGFSQYSIDGEVNPEEWRNQSIKILYILKESYGYQNRGVFRIAEEAKCWIRDGVPTYVHIAHLAASIFSSLSNQRPLTLKEILLLAINKNVLWTAFEKVAVINVKKQSGVRSVSG